MKCCQGKFGHIDCERNALRGEQFCQFHLCGHLRKEIDALKVKLNTCKNDYWFMSNLLEHYSTDKDEAISDCIARMKFRAPMFEINAQ